jgi:hypothetical protein
MRAIRAAAAIVLLALSAGVASADDFSLDDVAVSWGPISYRARRVDVTGAAMSRDDALKLLAADNPDPAPDRFAKIDALRISVQELVSETRGAGYSQTLTYRNLVLDRVAHGRAEAVDLDEIVFDLKGGLTSAKGRMGAVHAEGVDFPAMARLTTQARRTPDEPKSRVISSFRIGSMAVETDDGGHLTTGRISGTDFAGRALAAPMNTLIDPGAKADGPPPGPEATRAIALMSNDLLTSMEVGSLEATDLTIARDADARNASVSLRVKRIGLSGLADGRLANMTLEGVDNLVADQAFRLDKLSLAGFDMRPALRAAVTAPDKRAAQAALPIFDRIEINGLTLGADGAPVSVRSSSVDARNWLGVAPGALAVRIQDAMISLKGAGAARSPTLAALGYDQLDLSSGLDVSLDAAKNELSVRELSVDDPNVGGARLSAMFNHASPDLVSGDAERAKIALAAMVFWRADLHLENRGALDRLVSTQAKLTGKSPASVRDDLAAGARAMAAAAFAPGQKPGPQVELLGDAAAKFVRGAKSLDVRLFAPDGIGVVELMMGAQLGSLGERLRIEAQAR